MTNDASFGATPQSFTGSTRTGRSNDHDHAFRGSGVTTIGDKDFEWSEGDSFTIPQWQGHKHVNRAKDPAILFVMNDKPVLDALGFYREESENK